MDLTVLIVSDLRLLREGIALGLQQVGGFKLVTEASLRHEACARCREQNPDVVLVDMSMPEALSTVLDIRLSGRAVPVVALSVVEREQEVLECAEAGVAGYVSRESELSDLVETIRAAVRGDFRCPARIAGVLARRVCTLASSGRPADPSLLLSPREIDVLELVSDGLSNKEVAGRLHIELATVKNHVHNILDKLNVRRRGEAVALMRQHFVRRGALTQEPRSRVLPKAHEPNTLLMPTSAAISPEAS